MTELGYIEFYSRDQRENMFDICKPVPGPKINLLITAFGAIGVMFTILHSSSLIGNFGF